MALPTGVTLVTNIKGDPGPRGPAGTFQQATAETVAPGTPASVELGGTPDNATVHFKIPAGLASPDAVTTDESTAQLVDAEYTQTRAALERSFDPLTRALRTAQFDRAGQGRLTALGRAAAARNETAGNMAERVYTKSTSPASILWRFELPSRYSQDSAVPLIIWLHNNGGTATNGFTDARMVGLWSAILDRGYPILSVSVGPTWGNDTARRQVELAYEWATGLAHISSVVLLGVSMGGQQALNILPRLEIPCIVAYLGVGAVASLYDLYTSGYSSEINAAFGVSAIAAVPDRFKPETRRGDEFRGVPMFLVHSPDDASCHIVHTYALADKVAPFTDATVHESTGPHLAKAQFDAMAGAGLDWLAGVAPVGAAPTAGIDPWAGLAYQWTGASLPASGERIPSWVDDETGLELTRSTTSEQPTVALVGSTKVARFENALLGNLSFARPVDETVVIVTRMRAAPTSNLRIIVSGAPPLNSRIIGFDSALETWAANDGSGAHRLSPESAPDTGWHVAMASFNGTEVTIRVDGVETRRGAAPGLARAGMSLGAPYLDLARAVPVDVAACYILHGKVTASQRDAIEAAVRASLPNIF